ncbi:ABC-2 type transport system ATP-binding protein [Candidatus Electrothrix marina]|uniref:ABC-2 type transport system ATP-binding protein n=1 Tax=Candidatus Electrothrix marina TaxID=1859130 RepID=A0A444J9Z4_9BACT|nr:ABC-2 type transport system ATP-binding protein [Candidatus Electrothrix marina]
MKMMTGYLEPTEGNITVDELDIGKNRRKIQKKDRLSSGKLSGLS